MTMAITEIKAFELADLFSTLSDTSRVRIISTLLEKEMNVGVLAGKLKMSQSAVSHQLHGLRQMRLIRGRRQGRQSSMPWRTIMSSSFFAWVWITSSTVKSWPLMREHPGVPAVWTGSCNAQAAGWRSLPF